MIITKDAIKVYEKLKRLNDEITDARAIVGDMFNQTLECQHVILESCKLIKNNIRRIFALLEVWGLPNEALDHLEDELDFIQYTRTLI